MHIMPLVLLVQKCYNILMKSILFVPIIMIIAFSLFGGCSQKAYEKEILAGFDKQAVSAHKSDKEFSELPECKQKYIDKVMTKMKLLHHTGKKGTFAHFGDSITVTMAFWSPLPFVRKNASSEMEKAFNIVNEYMSPECWRDWKGPEYGNDGGMTVRWAHENIEKWLAKLNPETALIMFGTNDLFSFGIEEYQTKMREVVQKCLDNGTIVLLTTIPPVSGFSEKSAQFADAVRQIAKQLDVYLIDYHAEIIKRRPEDWDGSLEKFDGWSDYNVPTLISRDGVHPSHPQKYQSDYSEEALSSCGYSLRNYLTLIKYAEVIQTCLMNAR